MSLLDNTHDSYDQTSKEYWQDELKNSRLLLFKINEAIKLVSSSTQSYTIDTGQSRQTVTRADLNNLIDRRNLLMESIRQLEMMLGEGNPGVIQTRPGW